MHLFSSRCLSVCVLIATLFCSVSLSAQKAYTISSGNNYLAHRYNTTTSGYELYTTRVFSDSCVWYSPNTNNYYFMSNDGSTLYYLSAAFATTATADGAYATNSTYGAGAPLTIVAADDAVRTLLGSNTSNYYFYNWDWGLAHGQQYTTVSCPSEFNSDGSECWRAYWLVYDSALGGSEPRWHMSTTSSYEPLEHIATFEPVRIIRHQVTANAQTGGLSAISGGTVSFGGSINPVATIGNYSDQITPAFTSLATGALDNCRGDWTVRVCDTIWTTHNFWPTTFHNHDIGTANPPTSEHDYNAGQVTSYRWTLSGAGTAYLTLINETTATPTVTYITSCYDAGGSTATLTLTITWPDGSTQSATAVITIPQHLENPTDMTVAPSTLELVEGGAAGELELTFTPTEHVNTTVNSVSSATSIATASGTTVTPVSVGQTTVTVTSAVAPSVSGSVTVLVRPSAPTISYTMSNDQALVTLTNSSTQCSAGQLQYKIGSGDWTNYSAAFLVNSGVEITARLLCTSCSSCGAGGITSPEVKESPVVTSGVRGSYVILNDYEDHSWSYYSDPQCPIRSLNPVDVKITYYGNGTNNMTSTDVADNPTTFDDDATGVKVGIAAGEDQNTFVYYKTLERLDGKDATSIADADDVAPYTTIPNPFQVRPTGNSGTVSVTPATRTVVIRGRGNSNAKGTVNYSYTDANNNPQNGTVNINGTTTYTATIVAKTGTNVSFTLTRTNRTVYASAVYNDNTTLISEISRNTNGTSAEYSAAVTATAQNITVGPYRGFYAWRVKSAPTGGSVYRNSNATGAITTGAIINAETPIYFLPADNNTKMGLELEALWAQAYVQKGNTAMSEYVPDGVTSAHERNFHVLNANANLVDVYNKGYSFTLSSYNPDGTSGTGANLRMTTAVDLTHDLRIENIGISNNYNGDNRLNANGKHLHIGRGIPTTYNFAYELRAAAGNVACEDARLRVESGKYYRVRIINDNVSEDNFHATIVFGCDYDRARATDDASYNALLSVTPTGNNGIFFGNAGVLTNSNNRRRWTAHWTIKSGTFQEAQHGNTDCAYDQVIYIGTTGEKNSYVGKRSIVVEGGVLAGIAGGRGPQATGSSSSTPTANDITYVDPNDTVALIRIKGGTIKGSVYGGAASSAAYGHRIIVITGSVIDGWVAGGCNGDNAEYAGIGYGNSYIYVGGNSSIGMGSSTDRKIPNSETGTPGGYVFGTGRGGHLNNVVKASMLNSTVVIADNTQVQRSVFGGGNYGRVYEGDAISNNWGMGTSAEHKADIHILGGTVYGDVYGGANQAAGQKVVVTMRNGDVKGNIYGGSNIFGTINQNVDINIIGGTVAGTVYGGGKGVQTRVAKDVAVTVGGTATVQTDVYGGSEEGLVNNNSAAATTATNTNVNRNTDNTTTVTVSGGQVDGNVYGGGYGLNNSFAHVAGDVTVNITGGVVKGNVFGCNNANGRPMGTVTVNMSGGVVEHNIFGGGNQAAYGRNGAGAVREPYVRMSNGLVKGSVFGGGLGTPAVIYQGTDVHIYGGAKVVGDVYGGGNAARVTGNTNVVIGN